MPIRFPALVAAGLVCWAFFGCCAALVIFALRIEELLRAWGVTRDGLLREFMGDLAWVKLLPATFALLSGLASLVLLRPHRGIPILSVFAAGLGAMAYMPLAYLLWQIHAVLDTIEPSPYTASDPQHGQIRTMLRLGVAACMAVAVLGLRPNGRLLVSRSLLMRSGRVDRQTLLVILGAIGLTALGDTLRLTNPGLLADRTELPRLAGSVLIAVGSLLIGLGSVGVLIDAWRMRHSILQPPLSIGDLADLTADRPIANRKSAAASSDAPRSDAAGAGGVGGVEGA